MARLPGLRPSEDRPSVGGANRGRVQVRNPIGDKGLQPQARPVDQYVRPQQPNAGPSGLAQLTAALASISPGIQNSINNEATRRKTEAEDLANKRIGGMSFADAKAAVDSGSMTEMQNPWFRAAFMKQYGERLAYQRMNELGQAYATSPDKGTMNMDQFVAQQMQQDIEQYGADRHFVSAYGTLMQDFNQRAGAAQTEFATSEIIGDAKQGVYETFLGRATAMIEQGDVPPEEIAAALRSGYDGNRDLLGISYKDQDAELLRVAQTLANEGHFDVVKALLADNRTGSDGTVLGPLMGNREFAVDATAILKTAETRRHELDQTALFDDRTRFYGLAAQGKLDPAELEAAYRANPALFSEAQFRAVLDENQQVLAKIASDAAENIQTLTLRANAERSFQELANADLMALQAGQLPFIEDGKRLNDKGEWEVVPVAERREAAADLFARRLTEAAQAQQMKPEQALGYMIQGFASNGMEYPKWKDLLASAPMAATAQNLSGEDLPDALVQATDLYMAMYDMAPRLLARHITEETTRDFFDAYRIATEYNGSDKRQALLQAVKVTQDPTGYENPMYHQNLTAVMEKVPQKVGGFLGINATEVQNQPYVVGEIGRLAEFYVRNGLNPEVALNKAEERFMSLNQMVNGSYVFTGSEDLPPNFPQMAERALGQYLQDFPDEGLEMGDITIAPYENGSGIWVIIDKNTGAPVEDRSRRFLTLRSLAEMEQARQQALAQQVIGNANAAQEETQQTQLDDALASDHTGVGLTPPEQDTLFQLGTTGSLVSN